MKKIILWSIVGIVVLGIIAVTAVLMNLDGIIKSVVQTQASSQLQVPTTLGGAHLSILGGNVALTDLSVGSPKGFTAPEMFGLHNVAVQVNYSQLKDEPIHVTSINIDKPNLVIEQQGTNLNFKALVDGLPKSETTTPPGQPAPAGGKTVKLVIDEINLRGATVSLKPNIPGLTQEISIDVPSVALKNVGNSDGSNNGAAIKDVVTQVMTALVSAASDSDKIPPAVKLLLKGNLADVANQIGGQAKEMVMQNVDQAKNAATQAMQNAIQSGNVNSLKDAGKNIQGSTKDLGKNVGGLLKGFGKPASTQP